MSTEKSESYLAKTLSDTAFNNLINALHSEPEGLTPKFNAINRFVLGDSCVETRFGYEFLAGSYSSADDRFDGDHIVIFDQSFFNGIKKDANKQVYLDNALAKAIGNWVRSSRGINSDEDMLGPFEQCSINISSGMAALHGHLPDFLRTAASSFNISEWNKFVIEINENTTIEQLDRIGKILGPEFGHVNFALDDVSSSHLQLLLASSYLKNISWYKFDFRWVERAYKARTNQGAEFQNMVRILEIIRTLGALSEGSTPPKIVFEGIQNNSYKQFVERLMREHSISETYLQGFGVTAPYAPKGRRERADRRGNPSLPLH